MVHNALDSDNIIATVEFYQKHVAELESALKTQGLQDLRTSCFLAVHRRPPASRAALRRTPAGHCRPALLPESGRNRSVS